MLDVVEKYEHVFYCYEYVEAAYELNLISNEHAGVFISLLKTKYDATISFSMSLHVTANTFLRSWLVLKHH